MVRFRQLEAKFTAAQCELESKLEATRPKLQCETRLREAREARLQRTNERVATSDVGVQAADLTGGGDDGDSLVNARGTESFSNTHEGAPTQERDNEVKAAESVNLEFLYIAPELYREAI